MNNFPVFIQVLLYMTCPGKLKKKKIVVSHLPSFGNVGRALLIRFATRKLEGAEYHLHSCFEFLGILSPH